MIGIPNFTLSTTAIDDVWNRLIGVTDTSTSITHDYDIRGFPITETNGGVVRHHYFTPGWQCVEERIGTSTNAERQFVCGLRYIDDLILRDRSTPNNGTMNERRYAMQDGNSNTIAITNTEWSCHLPAIHSSKSKKKSNPNVADISTNCDSSVPDRNRVARCECSDSV
jgi:hypothetical protein